MNYRYWCGAFGSLCALSVLVALGGVRWTHMHGGGARLVFEPPIVDETSALLLPGSEKHVLLTLRNDGAQPVAISRIGVAPGENSVALAEHAMFPVVLAAHKDLAFSVTVRPLPGVSGELPFQVDALTRGEHGEEHSVATGWIFARFAQRVNLDRRVLAIGTLHRGSGPRIETVRLWYPKTVPSPSSVSVHSDDPAVAVASRPYQLTESERVYFCELRITVDPRKASARFHSEVVVRCDGAESRIAVLGWVK